MDLRLDLQKKIVYFVPRFLEYVIMLLTKKYGWFLCRKLLRSCLQRRIELRKQMAAVEEVKTQLNEYQLYPFLDEVRLDRHLIVYPIFSGVFHGRKLMQGVFLHDLLRYKQGGFHGPL